MSTLHRIHPIPINRLTVDRGVFLFLHLNTYGQKVSIPIYVWLIEGGREPVLVDTACTAKEFLKYGLFTKEIADIAPIEEALPQFGVSLSDIKTVLVTHLDNDHILNARKFPNARFVVQEREMAFARSPHPLFATKYHQHLLDGIEWLAVSGDKEIAPGIDVLFTPGHTAGSQSIMVNTERGKVIIPGLCSIDESYDTPAIVIPGMHFNPFEAYESVAMIRRRADIVLPTHSQRLINVNSFP